jgi:hypothetical protein
MKIEGNIPIPVIAKAVGIIYNIKTMSNIEDLILKSLKEFVTLNCITNTNNETNSKLVFPIKRDGTKRVSEQEARFLFVETLIKQDNKFSYSVEAPTKGKYNFSGDDANARSGNFDICLYENGERKHLIEFKASNPGKFFYDKDFEKLINDEDKLINYFIQVLEKTTKNTILNITKKYKDAIKLAKGKNVAKQSHLIIFLCDMDKKKITKYEMKGEEDVEEKYIKSI